MSWTDILYMDGTSPDVQGGCNVMRCVFEGGAFITFEGPWSNVAKNSSPPAMTSAVLCGGYYRYIFGMAFSEGFS